tara:strand:+ start:633 stop:764 length:132 start_codon:yes stop_codon:yes gene_type:complete
MLPGSDDPTAFKNPVLHRMLQAAVWGHLLGQLQMKFRDSQKLG